MTIASKGLKAAIGLAVLGASPVMADAPPSYDVTGFAVAGLKLGMTPQAVGQVLSKAYGLTAKPEGNKPPKLETAQIFNRPSNPDPKDKALCPEQSVKPSNGLNVEYTQSRMRGEFDDVFYLSGMSVRDKDYLITVEFGEKPVNKAESDPCKAFAVGVTGVSVTLRPGLAVGTQDLTQFSQAAVMRYGAPSFDHRASKIKLGATRDASGLYVWCRLKDVKAGTKTVKTCSDAPMMYVSASGTQLKLLDDRDYARLYAEDKATRNQTLNKPPF